ncbi:MAG: hypothetical protein Q9169_000021 [Polycauliona sp. 2 TL-2023]
MGKSYRSVPFQLIVSLAFATLSLGQANPSTEATIYSRDIATCAANDTKISNTFGETEYVLVQPNCDAAIDAVCRGAPLLMANISYATYTATASSRQTRPDSDDDPEPCQVHLVGLGTSNLLRLTYATCVAGFQNITVNCMLLNYGAYAKRGAQAGVKGVQISYPSPPQGAPEPGDEGFKAPTDVFIRSLGLLDPGFLVGPPGYFGNVSLPLEYAEPLKVSPQPIEIRVQTTPAQG